MQVQLKKDVTFKSGKSWKKGNELLIETYSREGVKVPTHATVYNLQTAQEITFKMNRLHILSDAFIQISHDMLDEAMVDSVVESMTGERVEPDGYDAEGFPSILMALGLC